ncbi:hypothetical protein RZE82_02130 [Mollicutes bacterium LVI A0039]|nr:hypothetical protein RZE82_02130 [Mollicutes bacterium LVI A0039]
MNSKVINFINEFNSESTNIGEVDYYFWLMKSYEALYYFYPLLERLLINIVALESRWTIEVDSQRRLKTANSVLNDNIIVNEKVTNKLKKIFGENGPRNLLLHGNAFKNDENLSRHLIEVKCLTLELMHHYLRESRH